MLMNIRRFPMLQLRRPHLSLKVAPQCYNAFESSYDCGDDCGGAGGGGGGRKDPPKCGRFDDPCPRPYPPPNDDNDIFLCTFLCVVVGVSLVTLLGLFCPGGPLEERVFDQCDLNKKLSIYCNRASV